MKQSLIIQNRLHVCRAERRITQADLAKKLGVARSTIVKIEKGNYNPSLEIAFKLAEFFNTSIHSIFFRRGEK